MNNKYPTTKPSLNLDFANTKSLDPRITFRRGTPGTYYDGVTHAKAEENLLSYSEDISNADWVKNESTVSSNSIAAPDGGTTADKIVESNQAGNHSVYQIANLSSTTSQFVFSVYAKAGERSVLSLNGNRTAFFSVLFDLTNGSFISKFESDCRIDSYSIVDAGNQWFRCSVVVSPTFSDTSPRLNLSVADSNVPGFDSVYRPTYTGDGSSGLYIWGAQLEQRDAVTSYTATNGTPITKYQPKLMTASPDTARFDHDPITGESKGLLIEEQRTNLNTWSEDFSSWTTFGSILLHNNVVAPDAKLTGSVLRSNLDGDGYVGTEKQTNVSYTQGEYYTSSIYAKKGSASYLQLLFVSSVSLDFANFNLSTGEISGTYSNALIEYVGNDWYRCSLTVISGITLTTSGTIVSIINDMSSTRGQAKTDTGRDEDIYIWGAQLETGSFPTSYIKTTGASATRSADNASITGENFSSWYRQDEGSIYADILPNYAIHYGTAALTIGTTQDSLSFSPGSKGQVRFFIRTNNVSEATIDRTGYSGYNLKLSATYASDYAYFSVNGQTIGEDTSVLLPSVDNMRIGQDRFGSEMCAHIKKIAYYPQRLTNEQLQNLTK